MKTIVGDLVGNAFDYDAIVHGCNCFCNMGAGIAATIKKIFPEAMEKDNATPKGSYNKMGTLSVAIATRGDQKIAIINAYTQFYPGPDLDLDALRLCFRKINRAFNGRHIGIPLIGAGLAGGDWDVISKVIKEEMTKCKVTVVIWEGDKQNIAKYGNS